jgi:hypothetical protein
MQGKSVHVIIALAACITLSNCATQPAPQHKLPGFLPDYSLLKPLETSDTNVKAYVYHAPNINRNEYKAIIVEPVILYQHAMESGITKEQINAAKLALNNDLKTALMQKKIKLTTTAGPGVAQLSVAITGVEVDNEGFKPRNLLPISAVIKLSSMAVGLDAKKPVLAIETKVEDSKTLKLLTASVTTISGESFRHQVATPEEFTLIAKEWVKNAVRYALTPR